MYRLLFDNLVVLDDIEPNDSGPYEWSPGQLDRGRPGSQLSSWLTLPWGGPSCVVLPGFHSHAENAMKKGSSAGNELFLATCGLMATGTETILISRWRPGGQISFDLVREFVQELPSVPPVDAWQRAVQVAAEKSIDNDLEPRVKPLKGEPPKGDFPFFWAGYALIDSGRISESSPDDGNRQEAPPAANLNAKRPVAPPPPAKVEEVGDADADDASADDASANIDKKEQAAIDAAAKAAGIKAPRPVK
jgi:hypothetical protein